MKLDELYRPSLALLTDLYQLTMAQGYWHQQMADREAVFHLFFRKIPFAGGYAVAAGMKTAIQWIDAFRFGAEDCDYLATLTGNDGKQLFRQAFLSELRELRLSVDIDAVCEGTVVFATQPLLRVTGPLWQCQLLETALLNIVNFQTLIATKAARICQTAGKDPVLEFGLRRAQGIDGGLSASRAAHIGGCAATSNVLAGKLYGIPVRGTHAHSWVMSFDDEAESFAAYADAMPNNCVFLVDTYDTIEGVKKAIQVGRTLREAGHNMVGIRLDSGDLAYLSTAARKLLDAADFSDAAIVASNDLDEHVIESLKRQDAKIKVWGVGTRLVTGGDQAALGGVYKLGAIRDQAGNWQPKIKLSEQKVKISIPGALNVRRFSGGDGRFLGDMIFRQDGAGGDPGAEGKRIDLVDITDATRFKTISNDATWTDLLQPVVRVGRVVSDDEPLSVMRQRSADQLRRLHPSVRRLLNPHEYPVGLERGLHDCRENMIAALRRGES